MKDTGTVPLGALFETIKGQGTGITMLDFTLLAMCDTLRIARHRSIASFSLPLMADISAYCLAPNQPCLPITFFTPTAGCCGLSRTQVK